jgi:hypothetical protein
MLSDLSYLQELLYRSTSFNSSERASILLYVKNNKWELAKVIKILENEQLGLGYIKHDYKKHITMIWQTFHNDIKQEINNKRVKNINIYKKKIRNMRFVESRENIVSLKKMNSLIENL